MVRFTLVALVGVGGMFLGGCHGAENCRLKQEAARLERENAELRTSTAALIKENQALQAAAAEDDEDDDAPEDLQLMQPRSGKKDLIDPFDVAKHEGPLEMAQDAYVHGQYSTAIKHARSALPREPEKAWRLIGASQCFLKDRGGAAEAYSHLDPQGQRFLKYVCSRNTIKL